MPALTLRNIMLHASLQVVLIGAFSAGHVHASEKMSAVEKLTQKAKIIPRACRDLSQEIKDVLAPVAPEKKDFIAPQNADRALQSLTKCSKAGPELSEEMLMLIEKATNEDPGRGVATAWAMTSASCDGDCMKLTRGLITVASAEGLSKDKQSKFKQMIAEVLKKSRYPGDASLSLEIAAIELALEKKLWSLTAEQKSELAALKEDVKKMRQERDRRLNLGDEPTSSAKQDNDKKAAQAYAYEFQTARPLSVKLRKIIGDWK